MRYVPCIPNSYIRQCQTEWEKLKVISVRCGMRTSTLFVKPVLQVLSRAVWQENESVKIQRAQELTLSKAAGYNLQNLSY